MMHRPGLIDACSHAPRRSKGRRGLVQPELTVVLLAVALLSTPGRTGVQDTKKEHFDSGKLKAEYGVDAEGRRHGRYVEYFESGKKRIQANFSRGELDGEFIEFYESGEVSGKKVLAKGKPVGE